MPRVGPIYTLPAGYFATPGTTILTTQHNPPLEDIAQALTNSLASDGSTPLVGNLQMNANKITGLAAATNPADAARFDQVTSLPGLTATVAELNFTAGGTSAFQTQLDAKAPAAGLHTIWLPASAFLPTVTNGATYVSQELPTNDVMVASYSFSPTTDQKIQAMVAMPKSWNEGTFTAQMLWRESTIAGTGDVIWAVRALALGNTDAMDAAFGTAITVTDTYIASDDLHISPTTAAITAAGTPAEGDLLVVEVFRDADAAGDTYAQNARLVGVRLFYNTNAGDDT